MTTLQIFDVDHGNCALLTCNDGSRIMIDCGHNAKMPWFPGNHLRKLNVSHLDVLVITNYDQDHVSGFPNLADQVSIGYLIRNTSVTPQLIRQMKKNRGGISTAMDRFVHAIQNQFGPLRLAFLPTFMGVEWAVYFNQYSAFSDENNLSLVFRLRIGDVTFLFPGDLEEAGWRYLLATNYEFANAVREVTVLIAAHHGRENGICKELFQEYGCQPQVIVISDGGRQYDTQDSTDYYYSQCLGIRGFKLANERRVLSTRQDGELTFKWTHQGCQVF